ncbi:MULTISPECIES: peptide chain release factor N(5)-glutamine methyltransferase [unclassified Wenzhouxiangella]|uniref:peptide chain release factor N(5)-glutamine methyltransferase n=1 Tax=unclassified Wenzhouxiangella TaxID=2613841 RepID=UPI000E32A309|nr:MULTISPECIES: peptide chain release factor N(5)-glutamine methyltransferase [unclassified Wenzhouxiangella]RFF27723.1 peptide chain release factor N(5)-glutamine methyltransferase [Wenzhouxiangella sp. 15181]RFP69814.1 peptide chain release factor N(5)-glutamine methyltransferase [Wenzhouxiangella sp. 15190]
MPPESSSGSPIAQTVSEALQHARNRLSDRLETDLLACKALGCNRSWLYAHGKDLIDTRALERFENLVAARIQGKPVAQLLGSREFYGRDFRVDECVLVPRPETELLIDITLNLLLPESARVVDVGAGSGCIALTLAAERPGWQITATDISAEALAVATENRDRLGLDRVEMVCGDLLEPVGECRFDLIVSNPPYVADEDPHLELGDVRFEPRRALAAGPDGLEVIRRLVPDSWDRLQRGGWLLIEHGHDQAASVRALLERAGFADVLSHHDLAGIERVTSGMKPE